MMEKAIQTHLVKRHSQFPTVCIYCNSQILLIAFIISRKVSLDISILSSHGNTVMNVTRNMGNNFYHDEIKK